MRIEIPSFYLSYETVFKPICYQVDFIIDKNKSLNDLIQFIESKIKETAYQGKPFANPCRFRIQSSQCIFRSISKNEQQCNQPLSHVISSKDWDKIPKYLHWNCQEDNSYVFDLKIKNEFKFNCYQLIMPKNNDMNEINFKKIQPKLKLKFKVKKKDDHEVKQECKQQECSKEEYKHNDSQCDYKYDKLCPFTGLCDNDKILVELWKKNKLSQMTDDQLCDELFNLYENHLKEDGLWNDAKKFAKRRRELEEDVKKAMNSERHVLMGQPLSNSHILSIMFYCNQGMSQNLTNSQINGDKNEMSKYIAFDYCLFWAITILNQFTLFDYKQFCRNISCNNNSKKIEGIHMRKLKLYSGAGRIFTGDKNNMIEFITHTSFSLNFEKAKNFAIQGKSEQSEATILCLKHLKGIVCCDVSWISKFQSEMEIVVRRHCGTKYLGQFKTESDEYNVACLGKK